MPNSLIVYTRLHNQLITGTEGHKAENVVRRLGAVQAQDYAGALWGVGLRMKQGNESTVEKAIEDKKIVRTWPMRGTLHFVAAEDVRWMLKLLTPRVIARCALLYKQSELDNKVFNKCKKVLVKALAGGNRLTRPEMYHVMEQSKIATKEQRGLHILAHLAQDGLLCFGPRDGKQQTFTLLDEWLPMVNLIDKDESLAELGKRYFSSHGPATLQDYTWWSGLSPTDAKKSMEMVQSQFNAEKIDGKEYWMTKDFILQKHSQDTILLPAFDEYTVAYKDRTAFLDPALAQQAKNGIFNPVLVQNGQITGIWKRTLKKDFAEAEITYLGKDNPPATNKIKKALALYSNFLETPIKMHIV